MLDMTLSVYGGGAFKQQSTYFQTQFIVRWHRRIDRVPTDLRITNEINELKQLLEYNAV